MDDLDRFLVSVFLEDFKARWQELLTTSGEISSWTTVYYTALVLTIGWVLGRKGKGGLKDIFSADKSTETFLVLSLALINVIFILGIAVKTYHIQQIGLYLYDVVDPRITSLIGEPFNSWEDWRRIAFQSPNNIGKPEKIRSFYYVLMTILPIGVSGSIFWFYLRYEEPWQYYRWLSPKAIKLRLSKKAKNSPIIAHQRIVHHKLNIYFCLIVLLNLFAVGITGYLMISVNRMWEMQIKRHEEIKKLDDKRISYQEIFILRNALKPLWKLDASTQIGVEYPQYVSLLTDTKAQVSEALAMLPESNLKKEINATVDAYIDAKHAWDLALKNDDFLTANDSTVEEWKKTYSFEPEKEDASRIRREVVITAMWTTGHTRLNQVSLLLQH
jgi:hypothetical protein